MNIEIATIRSSIVFLAPLISRIREFPRLYFRLYRKTAVRAFAQVNAHENIRPEPGENSHYAHLSEDLSDPKKIFVSIPELIKIFGRKKMTDKLIKRQLSI